MSKHSKAKECEARTSALVSMDQGRNLKHRSIRADWRLGEGEVGVGRNVYLGEMLAVLWWVVAAKNVLSTIHLGTWTLGLV